MFPEVAVKGRWLLEQGLVITLPIDDMHEDTSQPKRGINDALEQMFNQIFNRNSNQQEMKEGWVD